MRIALIGLGDIAQKAYLPVMCNHPQVTPILCTRNRDVLAALAQQYRINECYTNVDELIAAGIDAAMIHSATSSHFSLAQQLLNAGIAVFVDKPLSDSLAEVDALLALAEQKNLPLFVGFNRRFAPLIQPLSQGPQPLQIHWQKNRVALPAAPREFIFDDFIHVLDSLRFLSPSIAIEDLQVKCQTKGDQLAAVRVDWRSDECLLSASMNRVGGCVDERLELFADGAKWQIESLTHGDVYRQGQAEALGFNDWQSTLYKRGFESMLQAWIDAVNTGGCDVALLNDIRATHALCEQVVQQVEQHLA